MKRMQIRKAGMLIALCAICFTAPIKGMAATVFTESKVEITEYREGKVISPVNVRKGAGKQNPKVRVNNKNVVLTKDMIVTILSETKVSGSVWYQVTFEFEGQKVTGYSAGAYIKLTGNVITPIPTQTPTPTVSVTPEVTVTKEPVVTTVVTQEESAPELDKQQESSKKGVSVFAIIAIVSLALFLLIYSMIRLLFQTKEKKLSAIQKKVEDLKHLKLVKKPNTDIVSQVQQPKIGKRCELFDDRFAMDASEVYLKGNKNNVEIIETGQFSRKDYSANKKMIDDLKAHEIIYHKFFGRGEVFDNSDVKLIEIRFKSGDSRYFNKKDLAAKNLIHKENHEAV